METIQPFAPAYGSTQAVSVTAVAQAITIDSDARNVRILNTNAFPVFVRISQDGKAAVAAAPGTPGDMPIGPNMATVITKADGFGQLSLVAGAGNSGSVYVTMGIGF